MKWTYDRPNKPGYYWYITIEDVISGKKNRTVILFVNSDLCITTSNIRRYINPVSVNEIKGLWAGPIQAPEESKEMDNLAAMMWDIF